MDRPIIFFDLDGTLIDNSDRWYKLHQALAVKYNFEPIPRAEYMQAKKNHVPEKQIISSKKIADNIVKQYETERLQLIEDPDFLQYDRLKENIPTILSKLKKKYRLVIVTKRKNTAACQKELQKLGLIVLVDDLLIVGHGSKAELIKENYLLIPGSFVIGDTEDDYYTAVELQIPCWLVADGNRSKEVLQKLQPAQVLDTLNLDHDNIYPW